MSEPSAPEAEAVTPDQVAASLTSPQRRALWRVQEEFFDDRATVSGHGMTMRALRKRGVVIGAMPHACLTPFGRDVAAAANLSSADAGDF